MTYSAARIHSATESIGLLVLSLPASSSVRAAASKPGLALHATVKQLFGDFPPLYRDRPGDGGSRCLREHSRVSEAAQHRHADADKTFGHVAPAAGADPFAILASAFSDELTVHFGARPKVFGVSVKDPGAVYMTGHAGKTLWSPKVKGRSIAGSFLLRAVPALGNHLSRFDLGSSSDETLEEIGKAG